MGFDRSVGQHVGNGITNFLGVNLDLSRERLNVEGPNFPGLLFSAVEVAQCPKNFKSRVRPARRRDFARASEARTVRTFDRREQAFHFVAKIRHLEIAETRWLLPKTGSCFEISGQAIGVRRKGARSPQSLKAKQIPEDGHLKVDAILRQGAKREHRRGTNTADLGPSGRFYNARFGRA